MVLPKEPAMLEKKSFTAVKERLKGFNFQHYDPTKSLQYRDPFAVHKNKAESKVLVGSLMESKADTSLKGNLMTNSIEGNFKMRIRDRYKPK